MGGHLVLTGSTYAYVAYWGQKKVSDLATEKEKGERREERGERRDWEREGEKGERERKERAWGDPRLTSSLPLLLSSLSPCLPLSFPSPLSPPSLSVPVTLPPPLSLTQIISTGWHICISHLIAFVSRVWGKEEGSFVIFDALGDECPPNASTSVLIQWEPLCFTHTRTYTLTHTHTHTHTHFLSSPSLSPVISLSSLTSTH